MVQILYLLPTTFIFSVYFKWDSDSLSLGLSNEVYILSLFFIRLKFFISLKRVQIFCLFPTGPAFYVSFKWDPKSVSLSNGIKFLCLLFLRSWKSVSLSDGVQSLSIGIQFLWHISTTFNYSVSFLRDSNYMSLTKPKEFKLSTSVQRHLIVSIKQGSHSKSLSNEVQIIYPFLMGF